MSWRIKQATATVKVNGGLTWKRQREQRRQPKPAKTKARDSQGPGR